MSGSQIEGHLAVVYQGFSLTPTPGVGRTNPNPKGPRWPVEGKPGVGSRVRVSELEGNLIVSSRVT